MFNINGLPAILVQNNRTTVDKDYYDDQNKQEVNIYYKKCKKRYYEY